MQHNPQRRLSEGLEMGDLARLVNPKLHIDEFKSKMGSDADIIVLSFKVNGKQPGQDLMNFIERGYEWVLDSDVSAGELDDGEYLVFVELERAPIAAEQIIGMLKDVTNLTKNKIKDWKFQYHKRKQEFDLTEEGIANVVPMTSEAYDSKYGESEGDFSAGADAETETAPADDDKEIDNMLGAMQEAARVPMNRTAPKNAWTESLRVAAGLK